jgi:uncharacterized metal-binding protein
MKLSVTAIKRPAATIILMVAIAVCLAIGARSEGASILRGVENNESNKLEDLVMSQEAIQQGPVRLLPLCAKEAENLNIILACDGAASVGQVGNQVAIELTNSNQAARMCCMTAVAAESKAHVGIAQRARKLIVINGCANRCASKVLEKLGIPYGHETVIAEEGVKKVPTLDFDMADVERIAQKIAKQALGVSESSIS